MKLKKDTVYKVDIDKDLSLYPIDVEGVGSVIFDIGQEKDDMLPAMKVKAGTSLTFKKKYEFISFVIEEGKPTVTVPRGFIK